MIGRPPVGILYRPLFVIQMGWSRWGTTARIRWLREMADACRSTAIECETLAGELEREMCP